MSDNISVSSAVYPNPTVTVIQGRIAVNYHHYVEFSEHTYMRPKIVCIAPEGAPCRMVCSECDEVCAGHPDRNDLHDMGECNEALWINAGDPEECGSGTVRLPIRVAWQGEYYEWSFLP